MRRLAMMLALLAPAALHAQAEVWLTRERAALLKSVTSRPYVTRSEPLDRQTTILHWSNGARQWATTNAAFNVAGAKAASAWQAKVDAERAEKEAVIADLTELTARPTASKKEIEAIISKANKKGSIIIGKTEKEIAQ